MANGALSASTTKAPPPRLDSTPLWGYWLICVAMLFFVTCMLLLISPVVMPSTGDALVDSILGNRHYAVLLPMFLVAALVAVYLNWLALKFFRHT